MRTDVAIEDLKKMIEVLEEKAPNESLLRMTQIAATCYLIVETHVAIMQKVADFTEPVAREAILELTQRHAD
jgi:hypothetical protein